MQLKKLCDKIMKSIQITFGTTLEEIKEIAIKEFGTLSGVFVSTFDNHYRGNSIGQIINLDKEYPYNFQWHVAYEDRGIESAYLIQGNLNEILSIRKKMTDEIKAAKDYMARIEGTFTLIDGRWSKAKIEAASESNKKYIAEKNKAMADYIAEKEELSAKLSNSIFGLVSSRQFKTN